jgi:hypothetical protein
MCGPLALALPVHHLSKSNNLFPFSLPVGTDHYLFFIWIGLWPCRKNHLFEPEFNNVFHDYGRCGFVAGCFILVYKNPLQPSVFKKLFNTVQSYMMKAFHSRKSAGSFLLLGMANGFLPCAMVYVAIAGALTTHRYRMAWFSWQCSEREPYQL